MSQFVGGIRTVSALNPFAKHLSTSLRVLIELFTEKKHHSHLLHYNRLICNWLGNCFSRVLSILNRVFWGGDICCGWFIGLHILYRERVAWVDCKRRAWTDSTWWHAQEFFSRTFLNRHLSYICIYQSTYVVDATKHAHSHTHKHTL